MQVAWSKREAIILKASVRLTEIANDLAADGIMLDTSLFQRMMYKQH